MSGTPEEITQAAIVAAKHAAKSSELATRLVHLANNLEPDLPRYELARACLGAAIGFACSCNTDGRAVATWLREVAAAIDPT